VSCWSCFASRNKPELFMVVKEEEEEEEEEEEN
jgi:hypothetical protein